MTQNNPFSLDLRCLEPQKSPKTLPETNMDLLEYYRNFPFGAFFFGLFSGANCWLLVSGRGLFNGYFTVVFWAGVKSTIPESVTKITMISSAGAPPWGYERCAPCHWPLQPWGVWNPQQRLAIFHGVVRWPGGDALNGPETGMPASGKSKRFKLFVGCPPKPEKIVVCLSGARERRSFTSQEISIAGKWWVKLKHI